jgi:hypothetical protein
MKPLSRLVLATAAPCLLAGSLIASSAAPVRAATPHIGTAASTSSSAKSARLPSPPRVYYMTVEQQIAHWLRLSVAQVKRKLRTETDLFYVATDQHVRDVPNQVVAHELAALQVASNKMVAMRVWTRTQARQNMQTWRQAGAKLITDTISGWFRRY